MTEHKYGYPKVTEQTLQRAVCEPDDFNPYQAPPEMEIPDNVVEINRKILANIVSLEEYRGTK